LGLRDCALRCQWQSMLQKMIRPEGVYRRASPVDATIAFRYVRIRSAAYAPRCSGADAGTPLTSRTAFTSYLRTPNRVNRIRLACKTVYLCGRRIGTPPGIIGPRVGRAHPTVAVESGPSMHFLPHTPNTFVHLTLSGTAWLRPLSELTPRRLSPIR